jgi:hypothetical protein
MSAPRLAVELAIGEEDVTKLIAIRDREPNRRARSSGRNAFPFNIGTILIGH